jgi:hypothetical protein
MGAGLMSCGVVAFCLVVVSRPAREIAVRYDGHRRSDDLVAYFWELQWNGRAWRDWHEAPS